MFCIFLVVFLIINYYWGKWDVGDRKDGDVISNMQRVEVVVCGLSKLYCVLDGFYCVKKFDICCQG